MHQHQLLGFIIDLKDKTNLCELQRELVEVSKVLQKDDVFFISGFNGIADNTEVDRLFLTYRYSNKLSFELNQAIKLSDILDGRFVQTFYLFNDNEIDEKNKDAIEKLKKKANVIIFSIMKNLKSFKNIRKELGVEWQD